MQKFTLEYTGWRSLKEDLGRDIVFFEGVVHPINENENSFPISLPLKMIEKLIKETIPAGETILQKIKKGITGWGPQESQIVHEMEECGIGMEALFLKAVEQNIDLEKEALHWNKNHSDSDIASEILEDLDDSIADMKTENDNYFLLCTQLEKVISAEVLRLFPIIMNSSSKNILNLEHILVNHVSKLADELTNLIFEATENNE